MSNVIVVVNKELELRDYRMQMALNGLCRIAMPTSKEYGDFIIPVRLTGGVSFSEDITGLYDLVRLILRNRGACFHFFSSKYYVLGPILSKIFSRASKVVITVNGLGRLALNQDSFLFSIFKKLLGLSLRNTDYVIFQNESDQSFFLKSFKKKFSPDSDSDNNPFGYSVIYSFVKTEKEQLNNYFIDASFDGASKPIVLYVGRQVLDKGIDKFYDLANVAFDDYDFHIIGEAPVDSKLKVRLEQLINQGVLTWDGYCSNVYPHIDKALCVIVPSDREGLPRVIIEAYSRGKPVIGFDVPGVSEFIVNGVTGYISNEKTHEGLLECLKKLNSKEERFFKENTRVYFEENFSELKFLHKMEKIYSRFR